jgi:hypothetical protein
MLIHWAKQITFVITLLMSSQLWAGDCGIPFRLALQQEQDLYFQGDEANLTLQLLDDNGQRVVPCQAQTVRLAITNPAKQITEKVLTLPQGTSTLKVPVKLDSLGLYRFAAKNDRLYSAVLHLISKDPKTLTDKDKTEIVRGGSSADEECPPLEMLDRMTPWEITLVVNSEEGVPANGKDSVTIEAMISSNQNYIDHDVGIILEALGGTLSTPSITIPRCKYNGKVQLTSNKPGLVTVNFKKSVGANMQPIDDGKVEVKFIPPVKGIKLKAPDNLQLLEKAAVAIGLVDDEGRPVPSTEYPVELRVSGNARLESENYCEDKATSNDNATRTVCFPEGKSHIDARLIPLAAGEIDIDASAARLSGAQTRIQVIWPVFHLLLAVVGGMMGGVILSVRYYWRQKQHHVPPTLKLMPVFVDAIGGASIYFLLLGLVPMEISIPAWLKTYQGSFAIALLGGSGFAAIALLSGLSDSMENKLIEPMLSKIREKRCAALVDKLNRLLHP